MNRIALACFAFLLLFASCQSAGGPSAAPEERDAAKRERLMDAVRSLEGTWEMIGAPDSVIEFSTIANGTVVREVMFPGSEGEMVNMYTLEGNSLMMTHYCAAGNQPVMRAVQIKNDELVFEPVRVQDLESPEANYMSDMKITFVDKDHINESWRGMQGEEVSEMPVFKLKRVR